MSDHEKWLEATTNKHGKIVLIPETQDPTAIDNAMVQDEPAPSTTENSKIPSVPMNNQSTKVMCTLRLEITVPISVVRPNLLPTMNDIMKEIMATDPSISLYQTNKRDKMTTFHDINSDAEFDKYFLTFSDTSGKYNCHTILFNIDWNAGMNINNLIKNQTLVQKLSRNRAYLKEHNLAVGSAGTIGDIYLIDPQTVNLRLFEKEYNKALKLFLATKQEDFRFKKISHSEKTNIVECSMKNTRLKLKHGESAQIINLQTIEIKCKRRTGREVNQLITAADLDSCKFGVYLSSNHKYQNTVEFSGFAAHHHEIVGRSARVMLYEIDPILMHSQITETSEITLLSTLSNIKNPEGKPLFNSIINLFPNETSWLLNTDVDNKEEAHRKTIEVLEEFTKTEVYQKVHGEGHSAAEHVYAPRTTNQPIQANTANDNPGFSTQIVPQRKTNRGRFVTSTIPSTVTKGRAWSGVVTGSPSGSVESVRSDISIIQEQNEILTKKLEQMNNNYTELYQMIKTQQGQMEEQEKRHQEENERRRIEQEQRDKERDHRDQEIGQRMLDVLQMNEKLVRTNQSATEQVGLALSSAKQNCDVIHFMKTAEEQNELKRRERDLQNQNQFRAEMTEFARQISRQINQSESRGEKRQIGDLGDESNDTIMTEGTTQASTFFQPILLNAPPTPHTSTLQPKHTTPMDVSPNPVTTNQTEPKRSSLLNAAIRENSVHNDDRMNENEPKTPLRANSFLPDEDDFPDYDEMIQHEEHPADPPDLAGKRL